MKNMGSSVLKKLKTTSYRNLLKKGLSDKSVREAFCGNIIMIISSDAAEPLQSPREDPFPGLSGVR